MFKKVFINPVVGEVENPRLSNYKIKSKSGFGFENRKPEKKRKEKKRKEKERSARVRKKEENSEASEDCIATWFSMMMMPQMMPNDGESVEEVRSVDVTILHAPKN